MDTESVEALGRARGYADIFWLVKRIVDRHLGKSRAGIMLGLSPLGMHPAGFLGGYFVVGSNAIVLNRNVLDYVRFHEPSHHNAYAFHVLLHEYLHTLGYFTEDQVRPLAFRLSSATFGENHPATLIAAAMMPGAIGGRAPAFFRRLVFPEVGWAPPESPEIEIVKGFDPDASPYIA
ncbi:MAG: hypothetical protein ACT4PT_10905 [Methanobacteriota archaeon]